MLLSVGLGLSAMRISPSTLLNHLFALCGHSASRSLSVNSVLEYKVMDKSPEPEAANAELPHD